MAVTMRSFLQGLAVALPSWADLLVKKQENEQTEIYKNKMIGFEQERIDLAKKGDVRAEEEHKAEMGEREVRKSYWETENDAAKKKIVTMSKVEDVKDKLVEVSRGYSELDKVPKDMQANEKKRLDKDWDNLSRELSALNGTPRDLITERQGKEIQRIGALFSLANLGFALGKDDRKNINWDAETDDIPKEIEKILTSGSYSSPEEKALAMNSLSDLKDLRKFVISSVIASRMKNPNMPFEKFKEEVYNGKIDLPQDKGFLGIGGESKSDYDKRIFTYWKDVYTPSTSKFYDDMMLTGLQGIELLLNKAELINIGGKPLIPEVTKSEEPLKNAFDQPTKSLIPSSQSGEFNPYFTNPMDTLRRGARP